MALMGPIYESSSDAVAVSSSAISHQYSDGKTRLLDMGLLADSLQSSVLRQEVLTLEEALHSLRTTLEDYRGQYLELQKVEEQVHLLDQMLKVGRNHK